MCVAFPDASHMHVLQPIALPAWPYLGQQRGVVHEVRLAYNRNGNQGGDGVLFSVPRAAAHTFHECINQFLEARLQVGLLRVLAQRAKARCSLRREERDGGLQVWP